MLSVCICVLFFIGYSNYVYMIKSSLTKLVCGNIVFIHTPLAQVVEQLTLNENSTGFPNLPTDIELAEYTDED
ncbi:hypothetical protein DRQ33_07560 [bacterium]|nr:MAG: hypothetical protein DRQ33_07560 [bacterium]